MTRLPPVLPALALAFAILLAGCAGLPDAPASPDPAPPAARAHALDGAVEPAALEAPTFRLLGAIAQTGPGYGGGEPSVSAALDGTLYVSFPGCDEPGGLAAALVPGSARCGHGLVYRSVDDGATWERLNADGTGRLSDEAPAANGDAEVAVDAAGAVYATDLGGGIQFFRSFDAGATWNWTGNLVDEDAWADRQWMAAAGPGHVVVAWMGGATGADRQVAIRTTRDAGANWTETTYVGEGIGWIGPVQFDLAGERAFVVFTEPESPDAGVFASGELTFKLLVARSLDGGATWDVVDTLARVTRSATGLHWSGVLMAPVLDVTGDGKLVAAWSEETRDPTGASSTGAVVKLVASADWGATWSEPVAITTRASAIMPWVSGGAGDRVAVSYLASDTPVDTDYAGLWDVVVAVVDGVGTAAPTVVESLVEAGVHQGGACARGGLCLLTGSDRALLDFFENDVLPDGRLVVAYPADPAQGGKYIDIRVAIQEGGTPLLERA